MPIMSMGIFPLDDFGGLGHRPIMGDWKERLRAEIAAQGTNMKAVSLKAGLGETYVRDILKRRGGGKVEDRQAVARALNKPENWLIDSNAMASGARPTLLSSVEPAPKPASVPLRGEVAANRWFEVDGVFDESESQEIPYVPGRFSGLSQIAFRVHGPCMDQRRISSGDYIICVEYFDARAALTSGDVVVVERRRGQLTERTCKELLIVADGFELWPRSSHPQCQTPIRVASRLDPHEEDGTVVEVRWLVIGRFTPL